MSTCIEGHTREEEIINECARENIEVTLTPIEDKMVKYHIRWFGHVMTRPTEASIRRVGHMEECSLDRITRRSTKMSKRQTC